MSIRRFVGYATLALAIACQSSPPGASQGAMHHSHDEPADDSDGGVDPTVAHFFNTATLSDDEAAVLTATQDGGDNADAGN